MKRVSKLLVTLVLVLTLLMISSVRVLGDTGPSINTYNSDGTTLQNDFSPEQQVVIVGTGFTPNTHVTVSVQRPDGTITTSDQNLVGPYSVTITSSSDCQTDSAGGFTAVYQLDGIIGTYTVSAIDDASITNTITFTDAAPIGTTTSLTISVSSLLTTDKGIPFSGTVSASPVVPDTAPVTLQCSNDGTHWSGSNLIFSVSASTGSGTGSFSGTFDAPTTAGTYYFRADFQQYTGSGGTKWGPSDSTPSKSIPVSYPTVTMTVSYQVPNDGSTPKTTPVFHYEDTSGTSKTYTLTTTATDVNGVGAGTPWTIDNSIAGTPGGQERWAAKTADASGNAPSSGSETLVFNYYHQYKTSASYSTSDGSTPSASVVLSSTQFGDSTFTLTLTTSVQNPWLDANTGWSVNNPIPASPTTVRWDANSGTSDTVGSTTTIAPLYYHQYQLTLSYSVSDTSTPSTTPTFTANQFGASNGQALTITATGYWFDSGSTWSVNNPIVAVSGTERWILDSSEQAASGTVSSTTSPIDFLYYHQFTVSFAASPSGSGSIAFSGIVIASLPDNNVWVDAGSHTISATPITGYAFDHWPASTSSITFTDSTHVDIEGTGTITAYFVLSSVTETVTITPANGYSSSDSATISGAGASPTTIKMDGQEHDITANPGETITFTMPTDVGNTRYRFNDAGSASTTWSYTTAASGTDEKSNTVYYQVQDTFQYTIVNTPAGTPTDPTVSYTAIGVSETDSAKQSSPPSQWVDYGTQITYTNPITGSNEQWAVSGGATPYVAQSSVSSSETLDPEYYHQYLVTFQYHFETIGTAAAPTVHYTQFGSDNTATARLPTAAIPLQVWVDSGTTVNYQAAIGMGGVSGWITPTHEYSIDGSQTLDPAYWYMNEITIWYSVNDGSTPSPLPVFTASRFGEPFSWTLTTSPTYPFFDAGSDWSVSDPIPTSPDTEQWALHQANTGTVSHTSIDFVYYHQFTVSFAYSTSDGTKLVSQSNLVSYTQFGGTLYLSTDSLGALSKSSDWADAATAVTYVSPVTISGTERYQISPFDTGTYNAISSVSSAFDIAHPTYTHQFLVSFSYSTNDGTTINNQAHLIYYRQFGGSKMLSTDGVGTLSLSSDWVDATTTVYYQSPVTISTDVERYIIASADGPFHTVIASVGSSAKTASAEYYHQFAVTFGYSDQDNSIITAGGKIGSYKQFSSSHDINAGATLGSTSPASAWVDAGASKLRYIGYVAASNTEQWALSPSTDNKDVTGAGTLSESGYYHQFEMTMSFYTSDGSTTPSMYPRVYGYVFGHTWNTGIFATAFGNWLDADKGWSVSNPMPASPSGERWMLNGAVQADHGTVSATTIVFEYYHQYKITPYYTVSDSSSPTVTSVVSYTQFEGTLQATPTKGSTGGTGVWVDAGTDVTYTSPISGGTGERWQVSSSDSGTYKAVSSVATYGDATVKYFHQYMVTFQYNIDGPTSATAHGDPTVTYMQFGSAATKDAALATSTSSQAWVDAATAIKYSNPLSTSSATERWLIDSGGNPVTTTPVTVDSSLTSSKAENPLYYHQFKVTITYTGDTIVGSGVSNINLRATVQVIASPSDTKPAGITFIIVSASATGSKVYAGNNVIWSTSILGVATKTITNPGVASYSVFTRLDSFSKYYWGDGALATITVYTPNGSFVTGGGWVLDGGTHGNFGFVANYNKNQVPKGSFVYIWRSGDGYDYMIKSNAWTGLGVPNSHYATFQGKANVQKIDPLTGDPIGDAVGGCQFTVDAYDNTGTTTNNGLDAFHLKVLNPDGTLFHEVGTTKAPLSLSGGQIMVHV